MSCDVAASYVGVSESTFRKLVEKGSMPTPIDISEGRRVWLREEIDERLDRIRNGRSGSRKLKSWD